ncbi:MAG: hypothetical protein QXQ14_00130 [Candidatus Aenigmatarchaeota archaeon]
MELPFELVYVIIFFIIIVAVIVILLFSSFDFSKLPEYIANFIEKIFK